MSSYMSDYSMSSVSLFHLNVINHINGIMVTERKTRTPERNSNLSCFHTSKHLTNCCHTNWVLPVRLSELECKTFFHADMSEKGFSKAAQRLSHQVNQTHHTCSYSILCSIYRTIPFCAAIKAKMRRKPYTWMEIFHSSPTTHDSLLNRRKYFRYFR